MVEKVFAQKKGSRQVWTKAGKRLVVTQLVVSGNTVVRPVGTEHVQLAFGDKKLKNTPAAQRKPMEKAGFSIGKRVFFETTSAEELHRAESSRSKTFLLLAMSSKLPVKPKVKALLAW